LHSFSSDFESHFGGRIKKLYTKFKGDISIFQQESITKTTIAELIECIFRLSLKLPHKVGSTKGKKISGDLKKLFSLAKHVAKRKVLSLEDLFNEAKEKFDSSEEEIMSLINNLINNKFLTPMIPTKAEEQLA
jgi:hypothetical protein